MLEVWFKHLPIYFELKTAKGKRKRKRSLSFNIYRNAHWGAKSSLRDKFEEAMKEAIRKVRADGGLPEPPYVFIYTFYAGNKKSDLDNFLIVVTKFMADALVKGGLMKDDGLKYITKIVWTFGKIDKKNPRVELKIRTAK